MHEDVLFGHPFEPVLNRGGTGPLRAPAKALAMPPLRSTGAWAAARTPKAARSGHGGLQLPPPGATIVASEGRRRENFVNESQAGDPRPRRVSGRQFTSGASLTLESGAVPAG